MLRLPRFASLLVILAAFQFAGLEMSGPAAAAGKEVPVVAALCDALEAQLGVRPAYRRVKKAKDGTITILGLTTETKNSKELSARFDGTLSVERITLSGIAKEPEGLFDISEAKLANLIFMSSDEAEISSALRLPEVTITHLYLRPSDGRPDPVGTILPLGVKAQLMVARNGVLASGGISLEIGSIEASWQGDADTGAGRTDIKVEDIHYPKAAIRRSDPSGVVLSLIGGGDLIFDVKGAAAATAAGGTFETAVSARTLGTFKVAGDFAGRSLSVLASAPSVSQNDAAMPAGAVGPTGPMMISRFAIRYEDQSLTGKLLSMLSSDAGMNREKLVAEAGAAAQLAVADIENQSFIEQLRVAVQTYLSEPESFTVTSQLTQPVSFGQLLEGAAGGPAEFFAQFPVTVTAND
jgi:hypothetical protein